MLIKKGKDCVKPPEKLKKNIVPAVGERLKALHQLDKHIVNDVTIISEIDIIKY
jgi:hypothetical protein